MMNILLSLRASVLALALSTATLASAQPPTVSITYGHFLEDMVRINLPAGAPERIIPLSEEDVEARVAVFRMLWSPYGTRILRGMESALGLKFTANTIDVYIVSLYNSSFSDPLVMTARYSDEVFVPALAHEIAHRLLNNNSAHLDVSDIWEKMYPDESRMTRNHLLVYATLVYVFTDVLKRPEMLATERDVSSPPYRRAWEIVDRDGYKKILADFHKYYH